jgi:carbon storage regulator
MLVLTRKANQSIMIGDDIEIYVLPPVGRQVRVGIRAPRQVPVFRKELYLERAQNGATDARTREDIQESLKAGASAR